LATRASSARAFEPRPEPTTPTFLNPNSAAGHATARGSAYSFVRPPGTVRPRTKEDLTDASQPVPLRRAPESAPTPGSAAQADFARLRTHLGERIIGQPDLVEKLLVCLLADGHLLVERAPGLAKTTAIKTLAAALEGAYHSTVGSDLVIGPKARL
jgi:hypothetical protein